MTIISTLLLSVAANADVTSTGAAHVPFTAAPIPGLSTDAPPAPPIVGGQATRDHEAVGALVAVDSRGYGYDFCSGTLVDSRAVVTAAHCIEGIEEMARYGYPYVYFVVGTDVYSSSGITAMSEVNRAIMHPDYDTRTLAHDIGVLTLFDGLGGVTPMPVAGSLDGDITDEEVTYVGWGITSDSAQNSSGTKRTVTVPVCDDRACPEGGYDGQHVYTYDDAGGNICNGDSGGAAMIERGGEMVLVGANSFGFALDGGRPDCVGDKAAAAATRVDRNIDFIRQHADLDVVSDVGAEDQGGGAGDAGDMEQAEEALGELREALGCSAAPIAPMFGMGWMAALLAGLRRRR